MKKSLNSLTLMLASLGAGTAHVSAAPLVSIGEDIALFINSSAGVEYNSNVFRQATGEQSELAYVLRPGVEFSYGGQGAPAEATLLLGVEVRRHQDFDELDGELLKADFTTRYDSGVSLFTGQASYKEFGTSSRELDDTTSALVPVLAERTESRLGGELKYRFSERLAVGGGASYFGREYDDGAQGRTLVDLDRFDLPVKLFYNIAPQLDAVAGYRYRKVNVAESPAGVAAPDYGDNYFFVGIDGQLFNPLWTVSADVGYQKREFQNSALDNTDSISANARITYAASASTSYYAMISRDYVVSPVAAESFLRNQLTVGGNFRFSEMWSALAALNYAMTDYDTYDREEDLFFVLGGISYNPNEYLSIRGTVRLTSVDGDGTRATNYDNEFVSLSATLRY